MKDANNRKSGFTLLELLIVIGIIAVLSVTLILVLNPAETMKKARDTQRMSDLATLKTALGLYLTGTSTPYLGGNMADTSCGSLKSSSTTPDMPVDSTGWIPVNFSTLRGGSPISNLPLDPTNSGDYAYWYKCNSSDKTFEVSTVLESSEYLDKMTTDGGNETGRYEIGSKLSL